MKIIAYSEETLVKWASLLYLKNKLVMDLLRSDRHLTQIRTPMFLQNLRHPKRSLTLRWSAPSRKFRKKKKTTIYLPQEEGMSMWKLRSNKTSIMVLMQAKHKGILNSKQPLSFLKHLVIFQTLLMITQMMWTWYTSLIVL